MSKPPIHLAPSSIGTQLMAYFIAANGVQVDRGRPFRWRSGVQSPLYCDARGLLSHVAARGLMVTQLGAQVQAVCPEGAVIAGVATGGIAYGAWVAAALGLPFCYVRKPKAHGLGKCIEGHIEAGSRVVVVEDVVSSAGSALEAVEVLRAAGHTVEGVFALFSYGFSVQVAALQAAKVQLYALAGTEALVRALREAGTDEEDVLAVVDFVSAYQ